jgi:hypothetical protein
MVNTRVARFFLVHDTETGKMYQMVLKYSKWPLNIPNGPKIFQMAIKHINIFQSKDLRKLPKLGFLVWKQTIWQPWSTRYLNFFLLLICQRWNFDLSLERISLSWAFWKQVCAPALGLKWLPYEQMRQIKNFKMPVKTIRLRTIRLRSLFSLLATYVPMP